MLSVLSKMAARNCIFVKCFFEKTQKSAPLQLNFECSGVFWLNLVTLVAVGAVTLGPAAGAILGGVFGITSFIQCFGMSAFGTLLLGVNPVFTFLVCVPTRILDGWLTGLIYKGLKKTKIPSAGSVTLASLCCPLLNTTFFMGTLVTLFAGTMREQFGMTKVIPFIAAFVGVNGVVEAIVCFVIGTAVSMALKKALRY